MKREDKVISLELAKQIDTEHKRLGIVVESEYHYNETTNQILRNETPVACKAKGQYNLYDASELGEELKKCFPNDTTVHILTKRETYDIEQLTDHYEDRKTNLANLLGRRYLCLLQNGKIKKEN